MTPEQVLETCKRVLDTPVKGLKCPEGTTDAAERLIRATTVVLSLKDQGLCEVIFSEAKNRMMIANAIGKKAWEM